VVAAVLRGGGAVEREERKGGVRETQGDVLILYRAEEEREQARKAVAARSVALAPLMSAGSVHSGFGGEEGVRRRWVSGAVT
jgi:hypothetical protein